jgi:flagellar biosynthesis GTPase FlhF
MQGYLTKPNKSIGSKKRFFVIDRNTLTYYENETKSEKLADIFLNAQTRILAAGNQQISVENVSVGTKTSDKTSYLLVCDIEPEKHGAWIAALKTACGFEEAERFQAQQEQARNDAERRNAEERARREAEEAERLKAQQEQARNDAERRNAEERVRREAEEAERLKAQQEQARNDAERRNAEELARPEAQVQVLQPCLADVFDIPDSDMDLIPRVETTVSSQAIFKVGLLHLS